MKDTQAPIRYARALLELALEGGQLSELDADFRKLTGLLDRHPEISHLVQNSTLSAGEKEDFLDKVFGGEISQSLIHGLKVIIRKNRFNQIREIQEAFHRLAEKEQGICEVRVITARPLQAAPATKLRLALQQKLKAEVRLLQETDPSLIGGMVLRFDGTEINTSFKNRLSELRQKLTL